MTGFKFVSELGRTGYGSAGRGYIHALRLAGADITWTPMVVGRRWQNYLQPWDGGQVDDELAGLCNRRVRYNTVFIHTIPLYFAPWRAAESDKKLIGVTVWETDVLPQNIVAQLSCLDAVIVPCQWNREVFHRSGVSCPIHVAPHVHIRQRPVGALEIPGLQSNDFVFYTIGEWTDRKGMHLTVESFCRAFTGHDAVALVVKTGSINQRRRAAGRWWWHVGRRIETSRRDIARILGRHRNPPRVIALTKELPSAGMQALHTRGDCYASLTRAEGWGLGAFEAAFAGKPVIMTAHGGQLDFLPERLSYQVRYTLVEVQTDANVDQDFRGQTWADPDVSHGADLMRHVFDHRTEASARGAELGEYVRARFEPERIGREMMDFASRT